LLEQEDMAFQCMIVTPEQQALDESATQAIVPAWDGQIGILTDRAPLLVKLGIGPLRIDLAGGRSRTFLIEGGIAQMKDNRLTILTDEATAAEDIDVAAARADFAAAEAKQPTDAKSREARTHQMEVARFKQAIAGTK
jgi:F-type H+-transporting ATPase subunit epsilon